MKIGSVLALVVCVFLASCNQRKEITFTQHFLSDTNRTEFIVTTSETDKRKIADSILRFSLWRFKNRKDVGVTFYQEGGIWNYFREDTTELRSEDELFFFVYGSLNGNTYWSLRSMDPEFKFDTEEYTEHHDANQHSDPSRSSPTGSGRSQRQ